MTLSAFFVGGTETRKKDVADTQLVQKMVLKFLLICLFFVLTIHANPDAKRLYDDLLSNYNRLIRPVSNNTDTVLVKLGLRLSQLIDLVSNFQSSADF